MQMKQLKKAQKELSDFVEKFQQFLERAERLPCHHLNYDCLRQGDWRHV